MSKLEPKNREEAFAHQLQDDVKMLLPLALLNSKHGFELTISKIESTIKAYKSKRLKNYTQKIQQDRKERDEYLKKHYPKLYKLEKHGR